MSKLFLMMRCTSERGKSTWCRKNLGLDDHYISRDEIRFSLMKNGDEYFDNEDEVFKEYCRLISKSLSMGLNTYADATHLSKKSRDKVINLTEQPAEINVIFLNTSLDTAIQRNKQREGLQCVPVSVIKSMYNSIEIPNKEYENINDIIIIQEEE